MLLTLDQLKFFKSKTTKLFLLFLVNLFFINTAHSFTQLKWRKHVALGLGGSGITTTKVNDYDTPITIKRSNSPGVLAFGLETLTSSRTSLAIDLMQGFSLSPFEMGVFFGGMTYRWYYPNLAPDIIEGSKEKSIFYKSELAPFAGVSTGIAYGSIYRQGEFAEQVDGSGIYFGSHFGADYQLDSELILRSEVVYGTTMAASNSEKTVLNQFGLMVGIVFINK